MQQRLAQHVRRFLKAGKKLDRPARQREGVHKLRVASRRLETALRLLADDRLPKPVRRIEKLTRRARRQLGRVRELDVHLALWPKVAGRQTALAVVRREMLARRAKAFDRFLEDYDPQPLNKLVRQLEGLPEKKFRRGRNAAFRRVGAAIDRILEHYACYEKRHDPDAIHRVRIDVKQLRYSLEELEAMGALKTHRYRAALRPMQDELGAIHDLELLAAWLKKRTAKRRARWGRATAAAVDELVRRLDRRRLEKLMAWDGAWPPRRSLLMKWLKVMRKHDRVRVPARRADEEMVGAGRRKP